MSPRKISSWKLPLAGLLLAAGAVALVASPAQTADHREAPGLTSDPAADLADIYAFKNPNNGNVVLALTVNPFTVPGVGASFATDVLYQFKIDTNGDAREDLVIQTTFSKASTSGVGQTFSLRGPARPATDGVVDTLLPGRNRTVVGPADGTVVNGPNGVKVFAGLRDDPFFFDFVKITRTLGISPGSIPNRAGLDFFAGLNVSILAVELPPVVLSAGKDNKIGVWATTSRARVTTQRRQKDPVVHQPWVQVERNGLPVINTVLIGRVAGTSSRKDLFNRVSPLTDRRLFESEAIDVLTAINGDRTYSTGIARALLPDIIPLDVTSSAGFSTLNGRRPEDDVIDTVLSLASNGVVPTDGVNSNDVPFLTDFPFFAPPHRPEAGVPARN